MKTLTRKIKEILFGDAEKIDGGTPLQANLSWPISNGRIKYYYWEGNKGLIVTLLERIEKLEEKTSKLK